MHLDSVVRCPLPRRPQADYQHGLRPAKVCRTSPNLAGESCASTALALCGGATHKPSRQPGGDPILPTPAVLAGLRSHEWPQHPITWDVPRRAYGACPPRPRHPLMIVDGDSEGKGARRRSAGTTRTHDKPSLRSGPATRVRALRMASSALGRGDAAATGHWPAANVGNPWSLCDSPGKN